MVPGLGRLTLRLKMVQLINKVDNRRSPQETDALDSEVGGSHSDEGTGTGFLQKKMLRWALTGCSIWKDAPREKRENRKKKTDSADSFGWAVPSPEPSYALLVQWLSSLLVFMLCYVESLELGNRWTAMGQMGQSPGFRGPLPTYSKNCSWSGSTGVGGRDPLDITSQPQEQGLGPRGTWVSSRTTSALLKMSPAILPSQLCWTVSEETTSPLEAGRVCTDSQWSASG